VEEIKNFHAKKAAEEMNLLLETALPESWRAEQGNPAGW
jgi:hypothetical protein